MSAVVSFIIPVYNVKDYIERCVRSVVAAAKCYASSRCNWQSCNGQSVAEIICVDDGSTDGSGDILDRLAEELSGSSAQSVLKVIHQKNSGVSVARNVALVNVTGKYVFFADSDDCVADDFLSEAIEQMERDPELDVWIGQREDVDDEYRPWTGSQLRIAGLSSCEPISDFLRIKGRYWLYGVVGKLYRREFIDKFMFRFVEGMNMGEDSLFMSMVYSRARKVIIDGDVVCYVRCQRGGSLMHRHWADLVPQYFEASRILEEYAEKNQLEGKLGAQIAQWALSRIRMMLDKGYTYEWMSRYIEALCRHPDFKRRVPGNIFRYANQPYKTAGMILMIMPVRLVELCLKLLVRFKRR